MNVDTGELIWWSKQEPIPVGFERVPPEFRAAAEKKLADRASAFVSLSSGGKLSKWARQQRKKKRKEAQASRRRNRG